MSDYTPTTEEVREEYADCTAGMYDAYAEFDRWLAEVKAEAFAQGRDSQRDHSEHVERERIIALLESLKRPVACCEDCRPHNEDGNNYLANLIALIKGEQK